MKYLKNYENYQTPVNEEFIGKMLAAATGAFKNFLTNISAPFKSLKDDFKKGMKMEDAKKKMTTTVDTILKSATDNINKAEDENAINQIKDAFRKELDDKIAEFDKEIKTIKESKLITEGVIKDTMVGARVMMGMLKDTALKFKADFDKKFAAAKDLAAKKAVAADELKQIATEFKKQIADANAFKKAEDKYVADNKIEGVGGGDTGELFKSYGVTKKEELVGKEVRYKTKGYDPNKKPEEQEDKIGKLKVLKVTPDGLFFDGEKEDFEKKMEDILPGADKSDEAKKAAESLGKIKDKPEMMGKVAKFADFLQDEKNKDKVAEIDKILGGEAK